MCVCVYVCVCVCVCDVWEACCGHLTVPILCSGTWAGLNMQVWDSAGFGCRLKPCGLQEASQERV